MLCGHPRQAQRYRAMTAPLPKFVGLVIGNLITAERDLRKGHACVVGRRWMDQLTTLGLLDQIGRKPPVWRVSKEGHKVLDSLNTPQ